MASAAQLAARARFTAMVRDRARNRPQGGEAAHGRKPFINPGLRALHVVLTTATATQPNTGAAGVAVAGDSLTTRAFPNPRILAAWSTRQTAGFSQLAYPTAHDSTRGFRVGVPTGVNLTLPLGMQLPLTPQEVISSQIAGSNTAGDVEQDSWLTAYDAAQGQHWVSWEEARSRMRELTTVEASIASSAGPNYSGTELINADSDLLLANRKYAWLGVNTRTAIHAAGMIGPDTGNDRLAVPCMLRQELTSRFFPMVFGACPVIESGNRGNTNLFVHTDENAGTFLVTYHLALLDD